MVFTGKNPVQGLRNSTLMQASKNIYEYNCSRSSIAGVCRDENGRWMFGFSSRVQSGSSFEAELMAVLEALKVAYWVKGLRRVILESDSKSVVDRISNQRIHQPKNQLEEIILECKGYVMSPAWSCSIQHTYREGNFAADALTKELVSESFEVLHVWNHPPESLSLILLADMIGMDVPRHGTLNQEQTRHLEMLERGLLARNHLELALIASFIK
ncbi:hypothetical protein OIU85_007172 [Salix viminalis]|uniref:RNase H type-1 domain-containing protein n=1 Tax=Salix viminalis TaxID=40686 RepID=A0A9Q0P911_SALVM|nr:hypothetical protein OIU85_007172 [Salix viminalis]